MSATVEITNDIVDTACDNLNIDLGGDWDSKSVLAMIENCSFCRVDEGAASDA
jgi:hypothetical protein